MARLSDPVFAVYATVIHSADLVLQKGRKLMCFYLNSSPQTDVTTIAPPSYISESFVSTFSIFIDNI